MSRDAQGGGTEADGSRSATYCSHCYQNGEFTMPDLTVEDMQMRVRQKLEQYQAPSGIIDQAVAGIPGLQRWTI